MLFGGSFNTPAKIQLFRRRMGANTHPIGPSTPFVRNRTCVRELVDACRPNVADREAWNSSLWKVGCSNQETVSGINLTLACSRHERVSMRRNNATICLVLSSAFVFVPWQAAYLWSWLALLYACGTRYVRRPFPGSTPSLAPSPRETSSPPAAMNSPQTKSNVHTESRYWGIDIEHHNQHILLLMMWLLVLAAPVLTVWVRTLWIAGLTAPFETDYSILKASPFVILAVFASRTEGSLYARHRSAKLLLTFAMFTELVLQIRAPNLCTVVFCCISIYCLLHRSQQSLCSLRRSQGVHMAGGCTEGHPDAVASSL